MPDKNHIEQKIEQENITTKQAVNNSYLQSQLLISMPGLNDPYFEHSVTLICQHDENGCFGLTINKPTGITVDEVLKQLHIDSEKPVNKETFTFNTQSSNKKTPALRGGPVQIEQGFIIHDSNQQWENTMAICDGLAVTASKDILIDIAAGNGPENYLLTLGCASWEAGQMEAEIINNAWLNCPIDKKILFNMPFEQRWQGAADLLGIDMNAMSSFSGHD